MDDTRLFSPERAALARRLVSAGILQDLLEYSAFEAVHTAQTIDEPTYRELLAAQDDPIRNRGILRAMVALEKREPPKQPRPYHTFAEPVPCGPCRACAWNQQET